MGNNTSNTSAATPPAARRGWLRILAIAASTLVLLLVVAFFVVTSSGFLKGVILPRVGHSLNATLTAEEVALRPFSELRLRGLKLQTTGAEPLLAAGEARVRYRLLAILGGTLKVDEILLDSPVLTVTETADGKRNTDALVEGAAAAPRAKPAPAAAPRVDLKLFRLTNATVRYIRQRPGGARDLAEVTGLNVTLAGVRNGAPGRFEFAMTGKVELNPPDPARRGGAAFVHDGAYTFTLGDDLFPTEIQGADRLDFTAATGALADLAGAGLDFTAELTPAEIKGIVIAFRKDGAPLGTLRVAGPFDAAKREGRLTLALAGVDRRLLNLVGAAAGLDFGGAELFSTNTLELTDGGAALALAGRFHANRLQITQGGRTTPSLDWDSAYTVAVDLAQSSAQLRSLALSARQDGRPVLQSDLASPMHFTWGGAADAAGDAALTLTVTDLDLGAWRAFTGGAVGAGTLGATVKLSSQEAGRKLGFDVQARMAGLSAGPAEARVTDAGATLGASGAVRDFARVRVERMQFEATHRAQTFAAGAGSASYDLAKGGIEADVEARVLLVPLSGLLPGALTNLTGGAAHLTANVAQTNGAASVSGRLALADLAGLAGGGEIRLPAATLEYDVALNGNIVDVRQGKLTLAPAGEAGNELTLTGRADLTTRDAISGRFKLAAESLDLTRYYDLFLGAPSAETAPPPAGADAGREPDAITLPLRNFICDFNVGRLRVREVDIRDLRATLALDGGRVALAPFALSLNGAPVTAAVDADLGVPGFQYAVEFNAPGVPVEPLINTFQPERKGQLAGTASVSARLRGAGVTGTGLQRNLTGNFDFSSTNLSLSLGNARMPVIRSLINVIIGIPDAIRDPAAAVGSLVGRLLGGQRPSGGVVDDFMRSPVNAIAARGTAGGGKLELEQAFVESVAFRASAAGTVDIAAVLTNSAINFPVSVALGRAVSDKLGLTPANHPPGAPYVPLPDFVRMGGTLGAPKPDVNYLVVAQLAMKTGGGVLGGAGGALTEKAGGVAGAIGELLGVGAPVGAPAGTNAAPAPNAPAADLIRGLGGLLGGRRAPDTNPPPAPQPSR